MSHNETINLTEEETRTAIIKWKMAGKRGEITGLMWKLNYRVSDSVITSVCVCVTEERECVIEGKRHQSGSV